MAASSGARCLPRAPSPTISSPTTAAPRGSIASTSRDAPRPCRRTTVFLSVRALTGELERRASASRPACLLAHLHRYLRIHDPSHATAAVRYARRAIAAGDRPDDAYVTLAIVHTKQGYRRAAFE